MKHRTPVKQRNLSTVKESTTTTAKREQQPAKGVVHGQIKSKLDSIAERLNRVQTKHQKVNESVKVIRSQGIRLLGSQNTKMSQSSKAKLIALYQTAQRQCESEHSTVVQILDQIQKVRDLRLRQRMSNKLSRGSLMVLLAQHAASLPLYIGGIDGHPPPLVGAIPQEQSKPIAEGHFVAAFVEDVWILAEVKSQISATKYSIKDIDDDEADEGEKFLTVPATRVIPLPHHRADPRRHAHALFPAGAIVLALYPQTTCFYKGVVESAPSGPTDDYMVAFEDNTFPSGYSPTLPVPQLYVLTHYEVNAKRKSKKVSPSDLTDESLE